MDTAPHLAIGEQSEEALDLIDPGSRGWREVDMPARAFGEPVADALGLVGAGIVDDQMDVEIVGHLGFDRIEELAELLSAMAAKAPPDHLAGLHIERGEQRQRAMALVVVAAPFGLSGPHRQQRLRPVERLDLALLV